jgi:hypothetical protein
MMHGTRWSSKAANVRDAMHVAALCASQAIASMPAHRDAATKEFTHSAAHAHACLAMAMLANRSSFICSHVHSAWT